MNKTWTKFPGILEAKQAERTRMSKCSSILKIKLVSTDSVLFGFEDNKLNKHLHIYAIQDVRPPQRDTFLSPGCDCATGE